MPKSQFGDITETQKEILNLLSDSLPHRRVELHRLITGEEKGNYALINQHLALLRKKMRPHGHDIVCRLVGCSINYQHVILLPSATDGRT